MWGFSSCLRFWCPPAHTDTTPSSFQLVQEASAGVPPQPSVPSSHTTCCCSKQSCLVLPTRSGVVGHVFVFSLHAQQEHQYSDLTGWCWLPGSEHTGFHVGFPPTSSNPHKAHWILSWKYFHNKLCHILFRYCHTMLYNLTFSAKHRRCLSLAWFSFPVFLAFPVLLIAAWTQSWRWSRCPCTRNHLRWKISVCLLLEVLIGCSSLGVYTCDAISRINDRAKLMPDKLYAKKKKPLVSIWFASAQNSWEASNKLKHPSLLFSPLLQAKTVPERNALDSFQMFSISVFKFPTFPRSVVFTCKEVNCTHLNRTYVRYPA